MKIYVIISFFAKYTKYILVDTANQITVLLLADCKEPSLISIYICIKSFLIKLMKDNKITRYIQ